MVIRSTTTNRTWQLAGVLLAIGCDIVAAQRPAAAPATSIACPVSNGSLQIVPPSLHIFGSGGVWFGDGPVYINLAWKRGYLAADALQFQHGPYLQRPAVAGEDAGRCRTVVRRHRCHPRPRA